MSDKTLSWVSSGVFSLACLFLLKDAAAECKPMCKCVESRQGADTGSPSQAKHEELGVPGSVHLRDAAELSTEPWSPQVRGGYDRLAGAQGPFVQEDAGHERHDSQSARDRFVNFPNTRPRVLQRPAARPFPWSRVLGMARVAQGEVGVSVVDSS